MDPVVFFHMNQLGDALFSIGVLAAARRQWPGARLISVIPRAYAPVLGAAGCVDEVISKPDGSAGSFLRALIQLRAARCGCAVLFSESPLSLALAAAAGIPRRIGFAGASLRILLTDRVIRSGVPSLANNAALGHAAGLTDVPSDYSGILRVPAPHMDAARLWLAERVADPRRVVVIAPGASRRRAEKSWDAHRWSALAALLTTAGWRPVLAGGPAERGALNALAAQMGGCPVCAPEDGVLELAAVFVAAGRFIGIDAGALHLAAALGLNCIGLFGPTDPAQIGPRPQGAHTIIQRARMQDITAEEVAAAVRDRYGRARTGGG